MVAKRGVGMATADIQGNALPLLTSSRVSAKDGVTVESESNDRGM
jgi:hypothetical protein